jgi:chemotaxis methyl-accepting protein methylase
MVAVNASEIGSLPEKDIWAFEALKELFVREKGFDLEAYKERCILRRIYLKVRSKGHRDLGAITGCSGEILKNWKSCSST